MVISRQACLKTDQGVIVWGRGGIVEGETDLEPVKLTGCAGEGQLSQA